MTKLTVENVYTRHKAKALAKQHFWKLLAMFAIVYGIPYGLMMIVPALFEPVAALSNVYIPVVFVLMVVATILSCGLMLGLLQACIDLCRCDEKITVGSIFHAMHLSLKGLGLNLWVGLKTFLWALPGYALIIAFAMIAASTMIDSAATVSDEMMALLTILPFAAMIVIFALVIPAALRYMLSTYILADEPNTGVFACVRESKAMMKGHKWQAFKLAVPVILVMYGILLVAAVALTALAAFVATTETMVTIMGIVELIVIAVIMAYFGIRMLLCYCLFYLNRVKESTPAAEPTAEEPAAE